MSGQVRGNEAGQEATPDLDMRMLLCEKKEMKFKGPHKHRSHQNTVKRWNRIDRGEDETIARIARSMHLEDHTCPITGRRGHWDENRCWIPEGGFKHEPPPQSNPDFRPEPAIFMNRRPGMRKR